jgi:hypothetical protein
LVWHGIYFFVDPCDNDGMKKKAKSKSKRKDQTQIALSVVEQAIGGKLIEGEPSRRRQQRKKS